MDKFSKGTPMLRITKLSSAIGADVANVDLRRLAESKDAAVIGALREALETHLVLRFRAQHLSPSEFVRLASAFGHTKTLKRAAASSSAHLPGHPEIKVVSNVANDDGRPIGDGGSSENYWHTDGTYLPQPVKLTFLYGRESPKENPPKTFFMNLCDVHDRLPHCLTSYLSRLSCIHYSQYNFAPEYAEQIAALPAGADRRHIGPSFPLVRLNPHSGRPSLYLPRQRQCLIEGLTSEQSEKLSDLLWTYVEAYDDTWGDVIGVDDLFVFDNSYTLHRREAFDSRERRVLWHITTEGEPPIPYASAP
ncbi:TauD/TfdA dioxygenase family protein [Bradyrhizobium vignae]|uniref:TauD/TfdA dioxygenase family protein n=1 Tax=Bradyrhizobium vignae TaxID=1549949 RepID=UPI00100A2364|nr:TauD/TfdA family dioxygenase [Bradyrhizobium vignae]RXG84036.1 TauD/TfdA family dioxygenase [Bradyrhizobium vignae]